MKDEYLFDDNQSNKEYVIMSRASLRVCLGNVDLLLNMMYKSVLSIINFQVD